MSSMRAVETKMVTLYRRIADLTLGHCKQTCRNIGSCCSPEYCYRRSNRQAPARCCRSEIACRGLSG
jgi:hypothetical protein